MSTAPSANCLDLSGQVALVTGASRGLGRGFAYGLARAGATVVMVARSRSDLDNAVDHILKDGGRAIAMTADVADAEMVQQVVARVIREHGAIDILVNCAGVMAPIGRDWEVNPTDWWHTMEVNVLGCFLCARTVLPGMLERGRGRIINITSSAAYKSYPVYSAYGASKAAVTHFTGSLAEATKEHGIHVFALSPGFVRTQMTESLADAPGVRRYIGDGFRRALDEGRHTPLATAVDALLYLASGEGDALSGAYVDARDNLKELAHLPREKSAELL